MTKALILAGVLAVTSLTGYAQNVDRSKAPQAAPAPKIQLKESQSFTLPNGLRVYVVENHKLPQIAVSIVLDGGQILENDAVGYVDMAGQMLLRGTTKRNKEQLDKEIDFIGASLFTTGSSAYAFGLSKHKDKIMDLLSDVLLNPTFPAEQLEKLKKEALSGLKASANDPNAIARNVQNAVRYGKNHPYGEVMTEETVQKISVDLIKSYHKQFFRPNIAYMAILGDITLKDAKKLVEQYFAKWEKGEVKKQQFQLPTLPPAPLVALCDKSGAVQSNIAITHVVDLQPNSQDLVKARLMNQLLGGAGARLYQNLREDKGYTYGAYSRLSNDEVVGAFTASASVRTGVTDSAIVEFMKELNRIRDEQVTADELRRTKAVMAGDFVRSLEEPQTIADFAINTARFNLPKDFYANYLQEIEAVTPADVQAMAQKYVQPKNAHIIVVGDAQTIAPKLAVFGEVIEYDIYGNKKAKIDAVALNIPAKEVITKYLNAIGGKEKIATVKTIRATAKGKMNAMGMDLEITNVLSKKAPNKSASTQQTPMGEMKQIFDGQKAYVNSPMGNKVLEGVSVETMKILASPIPEMAFMEQNYELKVSNLVKVGNEEAYEVIIKSGEVQIKQYYSKATGLKIKEIIGGNAVEYGDYREVGGLKLPHLWKAETPMGTLEMKAVWEINPDLSDDLFKGQ
jgi:predicted Zn-dependent peptidase